MKNTSLEPPTGTRLAIDDQSRYCPRHNGKIPTQNEQSGDPINTPNGHGSPTGLPAFIEQTPDAVLKSAASDGPEKNVRSPLSTEERAVLRDCELLIERGFQMFFQAGIALTLVRDQRLYREQFKTFEAYCRAKWDIDRTYAHRLVAASAVVQRLLPIGNVPKPLREAQVRPLVGLDPQEAETVWLKAVAKAGGVPTARQVKEVVTQLSPRREPIPRSAPRIVMTVSSRKYASLLEKGDYLLGELEHAIRDNHKTAIVLAALEDLRHCWSDIKRADNLI